MLHAAKLASATVSLVALQGRSDGLDIYVMYNLCFYGTYGRQTYIIKYRYNVYIVHVYIVYIVYPPQYGCEESRAEDQICCRPRVYKLS